MAIVQVSVFEAVNAITGRYLALARSSTAAPGASVEAAVASATRTALLKLMPGQKAAIEADYQAALDPVPDGPAKTAGSRVGERAATAILAPRADDGRRARHLPPPHHAGRLRADVLPAVPTGASASPG